MRRRTALTIAAALAAASFIPAGAALATTSDRGDAGSYSYAVYGDAPYGTSPTDTSETAATPGFIDRVNADPVVSTVVHVGDIHSGSQYCTESYDRQIAGLWSHFTDPLVYTPGDNEWTDCHKKKEGGGSYNPATGNIDYVLGADGQPVDYAKGDPIANLALIRSIFFPTPGTTLGSGTLRTVSQAQAFDPAHPSDAQFVENVMWQRRGVVYVTLDIPGGSNNDADPWYGTPTASAAQTTEAAQRTAADLRWLDAAFARAQQQDAQAVAIVTQADMWDVDGATNAVHLTNYEPIVASIASHTTAFRKPVVLFNGDSHVYRSDNPLVKGAPCVADQGACAYDDWNSHPSYNVPNFHRVVVHGSTVPLEYLRLTVTPGGHAANTATSFGPFTWTRVQDN